MALIDELYDHYNSEAREFLGNQSQKYLPGEANVLGNENPDYGLEIGELINFLMRALRGRVNPSGGAF